MSRRARAQGQPSWRRRACRRVTEAMLQMRKLDIGGLERAVAQG